MCRQQPKFWPGFVTGQGRHGQPLGRGLPDVPADWMVETTRGVGPFVTGARFRRPDGSVFNWTSRSHRKRLTANTDGGVGGISVRRKPQGSSWWMAVLFSGGALCFALGSVPLYFNALSTTVVGLTFFGGSVLFTCASAVAYGESRTAPTRLGSDRVEPPLLKRLFGISLDHIDWWAAAIQLVGTLLFNLSTFAAMQSGLGTQQARRLIWAPDVFGSVCFLAASWLCYLEVNHRFRPHSDRSTGWHIAALNMVGSIAFGVAAVSARYLRTTGEPANIMIVNLATFVGAVCFLGGAILLPIESAKGATAASTT